MESKYEGSSIRRGRAPLWLTIGLIAGVVLAPVAAVAATLSVVNIAGTNGARAYVAKTGQISTSVSDPKTFRAFHKYGVNGACQKVYTSPAGQSTIVTQVTIDVFVLGNEIGMSTGASCAGLLLDWNPTAVGAQVFPFGPGIVVPAGKSLYAVTYGGTNSEIYGYGYTVPVADAPATTPT